MPFTSRLSNIISILVGDDTTVQLAAQLAILWAGTIEIGNGESKASGIERREGFKSLALFRGRPPRRGA